MDIEVFIARWRNSGGSERANFQTFANELTDLLGVPKPSPATADRTADSYRFERPVTFLHTGDQSPGFIDLYRAGHFVMEAKQGTEGAKPDPEAQLSRLPAPPATLRRGHGQRGTRAWDDTMFRARNQADAYARAVSREDGWPPFLMIVDVGHVIEVYADFSGQGQGYTQFPDGNRYRIKLDDLRDQKTRERLALIWTNPHALDPAKTAARVTREVSDRLAALGLSFEGKGHPPDTVARFLMRCLFTMFAEDVELIPKDSFKDLLKRLRGHPEHSAHMLKSLWETMNTGGFSPVLTTDLKRFNGGLFKDADALPLDSVQLSLLIEAASRDWQEVEPAIFGTLLERALLPKERHKLGAHYTPRAYVDRLVAPALMEPLRADWAITQATTLQLNREGKLDEARAAVRAFHGRLCSIRVLDPACGSGNFLYVALELMKRLEGEVVALLRELGDQQQIIHIQENGEATYTVDPHQFLGIEVNPWAAAVAELVLWIGYLQWHFRTHGRASPAEPVLRDFKNIDNRDAVLTWASRKPRLDAQGKPVTRWDGETMIRHPVTGEDVPDPAARVQVYDYLKPTAATWPEADFIIGNPPFIGKGEPMRTLLGDGYVEALRTAYPKVPESVDFVMYWWNRAAEAVKSNAAKRFGLITTNSFRQTFNRRIPTRYLSDEKSPISIVFAIPDHPWVDSSDGADVRIAMTVAAFGRRAGVISAVVTEQPSAHEWEGVLVSLSASVGKIHANLTIGADITSAAKLKSNASLSSNGVMLSGQGFVVPRSLMPSLGLGTRLGLEKYSGPFLKGAEQNKLALDNWVLDFYGLSEHEARQRFPEAYQYLQDHVLPDRLVKEDKTFREKWWIFGRPRTEIRPAMAELRRYIVTTETSKHRMFSFVSSEVRSEHKLVIIALEDAQFLSVLSSRPHAVWFKGQGALLEDRPVYPKSECFDPFPFPTHNGAQTTRLRALGEELDAHRKAQQAAHPKLTLTGMYNVLEKLRAGDRIEGRDREIYEQGLIGILRDIHDRIDTTVAAAYGWPADLPDAEILQRLVDLNHERADEEARGLVRWLRPDYQNPAGRTTAPTGETAAMDLGPTEPTGTAPWPKSLPEQFAALRGVLADMEQATPQQIARRFQRLRPATVQPLLETLTLLGHARLVEGGRFAA